MTVTDEPAPAPEVAASQRGRRRVAASGPAARFEPGKVAEARHRNPTWIVAGVLLVLVTARGGVLLFTSNAAFAARSHAVTPLTWRFPYSQVSRALENTCGGSTRTIDPAHVAVLSRRWHSVRL